MASGVGVNDDCVTVYNDMKIRHNLRYIMFRITDDNKSIEIEHQGGNEQGWDQFVSLLPQDDCRYGVFDLEFETADGRKQEKLLFVVWSPDTAKIKSKMMYASSKDALKKKLTGIAKEVQATDMSEVDLEEVIKVARS